MLLCHLLLLHRCQYANCRVVSLPPNADVCWRHAAHAVQACITAAVQLIQARHPSYSPARCWHMLFAKYCELWQQQHVLMGLWANTGGWVGAVRAGGLLTVLRAVTPAEALGQETVPAVLKHVMEVGGVLACASSRP